jgi:hypothetical protein
LSGMRNGKYTFAAGKTLNNSNARSRLHQGMSMNTVC